MAKKSVSLHKVAVVQQPSVALHRDRTLKRGVELLEEAAGKGARLVVFPETWVPGYPEWLWRLRPGDAIVFAEWAAREPEAAAVAAGGTTPEQAVKAIQDSWSQNKM